MIADIAQGIQEWWAPLLAFGAGAVSCIWFRLWIDAGDLVRRAEMRAPGHFMDQRYDDFDAPFTIGAPTG